MDPGNPEDELIVLWRLKLPICSNHSTSAGILHQLSRHDEIEHYFHHRLDVVLTRSTDHRL